MRASRILALFVAAYAFVTMVAWAQGEYEGELNIIAWAGYIERGDTDRARVDSFRRLLASRESAEDQP